MTQNNHFPMLPSNRKFGWSFSAVFFIVAVYGAWNFSTFWATLFFVIAFIFAILAGTLPSSLTVLNKLWFKLGLLIGRFLSPIVLGLMFFVIITPIALITRLFGRDALRIKERPVSSYWIDRIPPGPDSESFKNQF
jgi:hypothetical protein